MLEEGSEHRRWILDPFAFLRKALRLVPLPSPDATTENGRRIATVHIDGDGFVSRAEVPGSPYAGQQVLEDFIKPYPFLTSVSVIEGEVGPKGMYPHLARELEPIARRIFADDKVEVASHTFSHPFFWQPQLAEQGENFEAQYGYKMAIPGYDKVDFVREVIGARDYIEQRLTTPRKPVKMIFWSGDALPDAATIKLAYDAGLMNVNGGNTALTRAFPSLTGLYPLIRPTRGGVQYYAPIINENVYTNLWQGPYYGFRGVIDTFALTDSPRRLRGLHLYYHFYSGTKQASIRTMHQIYAAMQAEHPLSLWMSDYIPRLEGLHRASLAKRADGSWQLRGFAALRTVRLDPALGWPDLGRSTGVAGVRDLPQGALCAPECGECAPGPARQPRSAAGAGGGQPASEALALPRRWPRRVRLRRAPAITPGGARGGRLPAECGRQGLPGKGRQRPVDVRVADGAGARWPTRLPLTSIPRRAC